MCIESKISLVCYPSLFDGFWYRLNKFLTKCFCTYHPSREQRSATNWGWGEPRRNKRHRRAVMSFDWFQTPDVFQPFSSRSVFQFCEQNELHRLILWNKRDRQAWGLDLTILVSKVNSSSWLFCTINHN